MAVHKNVHGCISESNVCLNKTYIDLFMLSEAIRVQLIMTHRVHCGRHKTCYFIIDYNCRNSRRFLCFLYH